MKTLSFRDVEQLSAYLDGKLSRADSTRLASRLQTDPSLRGVMDDLSQTRALLRKLPARRAPRAFTLTPKMAGVKPPLPRAYPTLRFATALATLLLVITFATNSLMPSLTAFAPTAYGMGGGGGGCETCGGESAAATQAPAAAAPSVESGIAPTMEASATPEPTPKNAATEQSPNPADQARTLAPPAPAPAGNPIPLAWQIGLLAVALACGGLAWLLRLNSEKSWRAKTK